ncbi:hypothetical protein [Limosilactobacillus ingluviei]|uniref:Uncharacterized protein n=1 Tax=Limosilactobacillus ingluviei TaxID=148604 RepID=A0A0R2GUU3_9LACO|nr:hypothetical protein [Limosilactobacillus ingluviei]KRN44659.1 hypothetical protein IV41_GL000225 [Limosilactobacillus ingluviei]
MLNLFFVLAILSFVAFILMLVIRVQIIKCHNRITNPSRFTVFLSWLLILVFFGSLGGIIYGVSNPGALPHFHYNRHKQETLQTKLQEKKADHLSKKVKFAWTPVEPSLNADGIAKASFILPQNTQVRVIGHNSGMIYAAFSSGKQPTKHQVRLNSAGDYDVKVTTGSKTTMYSLSVADQQ